jgi:DNA-binding response OmpR family regulator
MKILIAEDDYISRLLLSAALTKLGHEVHQAANGGEAWDAWRNNQFQFVISDWMMPDLDGLEFCRRVRAERRIDYTYIILLTARTGKTNYLEAMTAGADDFITKPFERDELSARIRVAERILELQAKLRTANTDLERRVCERTAELQTALRARDEFLSRVSHELRTPLSHVLGFAQILERHTLTGPQTASVQQIRTSGQQLLRLIDLLLAGKPFTKQEDVFHYAGELFPPAKADPLAARSVVSAPGFTQSPQASERTPPATVRN